MPQYFRYAAVGILALTILVIVVGFIREKSKPAFKLLPEHTKLATDVVAEVNGYERLETDGQLSKYYIKADYAKTFSDNHQELQNVFIQIYDESGNPADKMTGEQALYVPGENKNFTAYIKGNVNIETRDALKLKTQNIVYTKENDTAEADELVEFERENVKGKSFGATVKIADKRIELLRDVDIDTFESPELAKSNVRQAKITAGFASFDQQNNKIELQNNVAVNILSKSKSNGNPQTTNVHSERASVFFVRENESSPQLKKLELFENVKIETVENGGQPTKIDSGYALYDKDADRFELKNGVHIVTVEGEKPTDIRSSEAIYEQASGKIALTGGAEITQGGEYLKGDVLNAELFSNKKLKNCFVRGNAFLRQTAADKTTQIAANELNAVFGDNQQLRNANAVGQSTAELIPDESSDYSKVTMSAPKAIRVLFKGEGLLEKMQTEGRTTIQLDVPNGTTDAANKRVTADTVNTFFNESGKDIRKAEAIGNAELYVEPLRAGPENYRTTVNAPRFDCEFFPTGNNAKNCSGGRKTKTIRVPTVQAEGRGTQVLLADQLNAAFSAQSKDVERLDAAGNAKFTELDRNAISNQISFTQVDRTVRLRGGEPVVWDSKSRAKATEIDWDTRAQRSYLRGGVSTTYYSQKQSGGATPFGESDKPVFVTAASAEFDHTQEIGIYQGNARGWQEDNYVRADRFTIKQREGQFIADGNVQSVLYDVKQKRKGAEGNVPVFASAQGMTYNRESRLLRYRTDVDIRQGTDRITSGSADVYLTESNEVAKTIAETNVVVTQPGRKATGDWAQYLAEGEIAVMRGNPARVDDGENGSSQGGEITVYMRENRIMSDGRSKQNTSGRIKSVYKVKNLPQ